MSPEDRRARHQAWLAAYGFTDRDWRRIKGLAEAVSGRYIPAAISDLDAPWRVQAVVASARRHSNGALLGVYDGKALLVWPKDGR